MLHNVKLYGHLAERYGSETREIDADNLLVVVSGICESDTKMRNDILTSEIFVLLNNTEDDWFVLEPDFININLDNYKNIHIIPNIEGGAPALVPVFVALGASAAVAEVLASITALVLTSAISMGISALMSPSPQISNPSQQAQEAATKQSFLFNGAVNVTEQGGPVQLVYGQMRVGSTVISAGITTEDV